jgi:hypothetical protein
MNSLTIEDKIEISETLGGIHSWYGLRARPACLGATPKGHSAIFTNDEALTMFSSLHDIHNVRHGAICFPILLTEHEAKSYELVLLDKVNEIEHKHLASIPTSEQQKSLISLLANIIHKGMDQYTIQELEHEGEFIIAETFKKTKIFSLRSSMPKQYTEFYECMKTIKAEAVIAQLIKLIKEDNNNAID